MTGVVGYLAVAIITAIVLWFIDRDVKEIYSDTSPDAWPSYKGLWLASALWPILYGVVLIYFVMRE